VGRRGRSGGGRLAGVFLVGGGVVGDQRHRARLRVGSAGYWVWCFGLVSFFAVRDMGSYTSGPVYTWAGEFVDVD
jgi:hypothetical protein